MIYFDVTKTGAAGHRSGLTRVSARLREALGSHATEVTFHRGALHFALDHRPVSPTAADWFFTSELFSEDERPGFTALLTARPCRFAAVFHDAIPLKHPHITWPQSVARHPVYLKTLARFDHLWAVSQASRDELLTFWRWQGLTSLPPIAILPLGADLAPPTPNPKLQTPNPKLQTPNSSSRPTQNPKPKTQNPPALLCLGILEPRKNQSFLLEVCADLWRAGLAFELHLVGRVNPHFGAPLLAQIKSLQREHPTRLHYHAAATDARVLELFARARATAFPTLAEGCGLPLLESLAQHIPCVHSDLPVLRENADAGGCLAVPVHDHAAWSAALRRILTDDTLHARLVAEAAARPLPTWSAAAQLLLRTLAPAAA